MDIRRATPQRPLPLPRVICEPFRIPHSTLRIQDALGYASLSPPRRLRPGRGRSRRHDYLLPPDFHPTTLLDLGSGPGTALWAAVEHFPSLTTLHAYEREPAFIDLARQLASASDNPALRAAQWQPNNPLWPPPPAHAHLRPHHNRPRPQRARRTYPPLPRRLRLGTLRRPPPHSRTRHLHRLPRRPRRPRPTPPARRSHHRPLRPRQPLPPPERLVPLPPTPQPPHLPAPRQRSLRRLGRSQVLLRRHVPASPNRPPSAAA